MKIITKSLVTILLFASSLMANVGAITAIKGSASIDRDSSKIDVTLGIKIKEHDTIKTAEESKVQIIFNDETIISLGKNSTFSVDEYLFYGSDEPTVKFGLLQGAMRTITGKIGKVAPQRFKIKTNNATIGIRGTNFTIVAREDGTQNVYCTFGAITVKVDNQEFDVNQGFQISIAPDTESKVEEFTPLELKNIEKQSFTTTTTKESKIEPLVEAKQEAKPLQLSNIDSVVATSVVASINSVDTSDSSQEKQTQKVETERVEVERVEAERVEADRVEADRVEAERLAEIARLAEIDRLTFDCDSVVNVNKLYVHNSDGTQSKLNFSYHITGDGSSLSANTSNIDDGDFNYWIDDISVANFNSMNDYATTIKYIDAQSNADIVNINLQSSYFKAMADISPDDAMSWGEWGVIYNYHNNNDSSDHTKNKAGVWVSSSDIATPAEVINNYNSSVVDYSGRYKAITNTNNIVHGNATLHIDFKADTGNLDIHKSDNSGLWQSYTLISGGALNALAEGKKTSGRFVGETGNSAIGDFRIDGDVAVGVYQVTTTATLN